MNSTPEDRLSSLGITLPEAPAPAGNYVPWVRTGNLVFISGQISMNASGPVLGRLGHNMDVAEGADAAKLCTIALVAQLRAACDGDLSRVKKVVRLGGFVNATPDFNDHPKVINGASDLMVEIFGDAGRHARAAVGSSSLPLGVAVEVDGVFEVS